MHADGGIATNSTLITGHPHVGGWSGANFRRRDGRWSHFDWVSDGRNYIRGDTTVDGHIHVNNNMSINRHIDAHENWHNKKALFAGWASDQVVLGSHRTGGHDFARDLPANTVASVNPLHVHGNVTSTSAVCVGNTCMNEPELSRYKKTMPTSGELCANNTCMSEADLQRFKSTITNNQVCVNDMCLNDTEIKQLKSSVAKPGEICINDTCINEENLRQIKMATSPLTSSSLLSQKVLGEN
jgi:hypothetical protein